MSKFQVLTKLWQKTLFFANLKDTVVRDGPFDIRGGVGAGIFPCDKLFFFFLFAQQVIFFQSRPKLQQDFFF